MNCQKAQNQLSELLDRMLSKELARNLREHLAACPRCSEELADLAESRRVVASLPEVEPPNGLVTRVMADVRSLAARPTFWERLLYPLRVKLPLHATAVLLIGVLSVYLNQKESVQVSPLGPTVPTPSSPQEQDSKNQRSDKPASESVFEHTASIAREEAQRELPRAASISERPELVTADRQKSPGRATSDANSTIRRLESKRPSARSAPIPAQGVTALQEGFSFPGEIVLRAPLRGVDTMRGRESLSFSDELRSSYSRELIPDYELVVRRRASSSSISPAPAHKKRTDTETPAGDEPPAASYDAQGLTESRPAAKNGSTIEILWFSVPPERYEDFKKELTAQTVIESEIPVAVKKKDPSFSAGRPLSIKVTVFDAAD